MSIKTHKDELEEIIDAVIKLTWNYKIFRVLFEKGEVDFETRQAHPEIFLTLHDSLFCSFCVAADLLFEEKPSATSLWSLVRKSQPILATKLNEKIRGNKSLLEKIGAIRNQVCAHRWQKKSPQEVFAEVKLRVSMMAEIVDLARSVILDLAEEIDAGRKTELEKQQLSELTLRCVADDAAKILQAFRNC